MFRVHAPVDRGRGAARRGASRAHGRYEMQYWIKKKR